MSNTSPDLPGGTIADPRALLALNRQRGRQYSMYFVLLGAMGLVAGFVLAALRPALALPVAAVMVVAGIAPLVTFTRAHPQVVRSLNKLAMPFWVVYAVACALMVAGALRHSGEYSSTLTLVLAGAVLALLDGLVVGHFTDQASRRQAPTVPDRATH